MNQKKNKLWRALSVSSRVLLGLLACIFLVSCRQNYTPKPHAYYRIDFPEKEYRPYDSICPFSFEYPVYGTLAPDIHSVSDPCRFNINFPKYKGSIYLTYFKIADNFDRLIENEWKMLYSGIAQKADAVEPYEYTNPDMKVYGTIYDIKGNAASSAMFWVTDSVKNFLRGSLYFVAKPNQDSLAPAISFFRKDIIHLMETIEWKE